jgi:hypothetical protein
VRPFYNIIKIGWKKFKKYSSEELDLLIK